MTARASSALWSVTEQQAWLAALVFCTTHTPVTPSHLPRSHTYTHTCCREEVPYTHRKHAIMMVSHDMELNVGLQTFQQVSPRRGGCVGISQR